MYLVLTRGLLLLYPLFNILAVIRYLGLPKCVSNQLQGLGLAVSSAFMVKPYSVPLFCR